MTKTEWIEALEGFLREKDFGKNWDGAYQDALPSIRRFFEDRGFQVKLLNETESASQLAELVAEKGTTVVRIPWEEDYNRHSIVYLESIIVESLPA